MISQYVTTSSLPSQVQEYLKTEIGVFDEYIVFYTSENTIECLIRSPFGSDARLYTFRRSSSGYSTVWTLSQSSASFDYSVSNELYVYSNLAVGSDLFNSLRGSLFVGACLVLLILIMIWKGYGIFRPFWRKRRFINN